MVYYLWVLRIGLTGTRRRSQTQYPFFDDSAFIPTLLVFFNASYFQQQFLYGKEGRWNAGNHGHFRAKGFCAKWKECVLYRTPCRNTRAISEWSLWSQVQVHSFFGRRESFIKVHAIWSTYRYKLDPKTNEKWGLRMYTDMPWAWPEIGRLWGKPMESNVQLSGHHQQPAVWVCVS